MSARNRSFSASKAARLLTGIVLCGVSSVMAATNQFRGVNWADPRDNFQSGVLYLSGLSSTDTYASASLVTERIIGQFVSKLGTNSVRLPINEATTSKYWDTYTGVLDVALTKGRVILCYWGPAHGAAPANMTNWWDMWTKVVAKYGSNKNFYIEIYNEPNMYSKANLLSLYASWLQKFPDFPQDRLILDGTGMAQNVPDVGSDSRFNKCLLAVHDYSMWSAESNTEAQWSNHLKSYVGSYSERTVSTEWGGPMSTGVKNGVTYQPQDYSSTSATSTYFVKYVRGITSQLRSWKMGSFYWAGLKDGDWYSMMTKTGTGANINLSVSNASGLERLKYSWADTIPASIGSHQPTPLPSDLKLSRNGNFLLVEFTNPGIGRKTLSLMDPSGKVWRSESSEAIESCRFAQRIDLDGIPSGMYLVEIAEEGRIVQGGSILINPR